MPKLLLKKLSFKKFKMKISLSKDFTKFKLENLVNDFQGFILMGKKINQKL